MGPVKCIGSVSVKGLLALKQSDLGSMELLGNKHQATYHEHSSDFLAP